MKKKATKAANGVLMEVHDASKVAGEFEAAPHTLRRNASGDWAVSFDVQFRFVLHDGRVIEGGRRLVISRIVQQGRKPRGVK